MVTLRAASALVTVSGAAVLAASWVPGTPFLVLCFGVVVVVAGVVGRVLISKHEQ